MIFPPRFWTEGDGEVEIAEGSQRGSQLLHRFSCQTWNPRFFRRGYFSLSLFLSQKWFISWRYFIIMCRTVILPKNPLCGQVVYSHVLNRTAVYVGLIYGAKTFNSPWMWGLKQLRHCALNQVNRANNLSHLYVQSLNFKNIEWDASNVPSFIVVRRLQSQLPFTPVKW